MYRLPDSVYVPLVDTTKNAMYKISRSDIINNISIFLTVTMFILQCCTLGIINKNDQDTFNMLTNIKEQILIIQKSNTIQNITNVTNNSLLYL